MRGSDAAEVSAAIAEFLAAPGLAIVGVSRHPEHYSHRVFDAFRARGYNPAAVNPNAAEIDWTPSVRSVTDLPSPPAAVLILVGPEYVLEVAELCIAVQCRTAWIRRPARPGSHELLAAELMRRAGITVITGVCPFLVLEPDVWPHRFHAVFTRVTGRLGRVFVPDAERTPDARAE